MTLISKIANLFAFSTVKIVAGTMKLFYIFSRGQQDLTIRLAINCFSTRARQGSYIKGEWMKSIIFFSMLLAAGAHAEDQNGGGADTNRSTVKAPAEATQSQKKDIDEEITNARMRASSGAKSLLSLQTSFGYNGGSVNDALSKERPTLTPGAVELETVKLTGTVAAKYRVTDHDNVNLGVGVGWVTPTYSGQKGQMENPYVGYTRTFKAGDYQNVFNVQLQKYTADKSVRISKLGYEFDVNHTILTNVGNTKLQVGLVGKYARETYTAKTKVVEDTEIKVDGTQDQVALYPFAEYEFTEHIAFRTVYRGLEYQTSVLKSDTFQRNDPTQSAGIGLTITRDLYLYPNIQWVWEDMRPEKTNVALSAYINM